MSAQKNGTLSPLASGQWSTGWPLSEAFDYNGQAYCFFYQSTDGQVEVDQLTPSDDNSPGWLGVLTATISTGYTKLVLYIDPSTTKPIALLYNEVTGDYQFYEIKL